MSVSDEKELLLDGARRTPPDIEDAFELRDDDAGLLASHGDSLHGVTVQLDAFAVNGGARLAVLFLLLDRSAYGGEVAGDSDGWSRETGAVVMMRVLRRGEEVNRGREVSIGEREEVGR